MNVQFVRDKEGCIVGTEGVVHDITERKLSDDSLKVKEAAIASSISGIAISDLAARVTYVNDAFVQMSRFDNAAEVLDRSILDFVQDSTSIVPVIDAVTTQGYWLGEFLAQRKDGTTFQAQLAANRVNGDDGRPICLLASFLDLSERKRAELALRESEARFRAVIDASPVPMALNDEQANITYLNPAFVQTFGFSMQDIPTVADWWPRAYPDPDYRRSVVDEWQARLEQATRTGRAFEPTEVVVRTSHGTDRTVLVSASPLTHGSGREHLVMLYDITDRQGGVPST